MKHKYIYYITVQDSLPEILTGMELSESSIRSMTLITVPDFLFNSHNFYAKEEVVDKNVSYLACAQYM